MKPINELEIGQRFKFSDGDSPCVYAGESPCGRWFAYWEQRNVKAGPDTVMQVWSIEEASDGEEEVICE